MIALSRDTYVLAFQKLVLYEIPLKTIWLQFVFVAYFIGLAILRECGFFLHKNNHDALFLLFALFCPAYMFLWWK